MFTSKKKWSPWWRCVKRTKICQTVYLNKEKLSVPKLVFFKTNTDSIQHSQHMTQTLYINLPLLKCQKCVAWNDWCWNIKKWKLCVMYMSWNILCDCQRWLTIFGRQWISSIQVVWDVLLSQVTPQHFRRLQSLYVQLRAAQGLLSGSNWPEKVLYQQLWQWERRQCTTQEFGSVG